MTKIARVDGQMIVKQAGGTVSEFYEEEFILDDSIDTIPKARQIIQAGLIRERLEKKTNGFKRWRTCQIVELKDSVEKIDSTDSELQSLLNKCASLNCIPENIHNYKRPDFKIKALKQAIDKHVERINKLSSKKDNVQDMGYVD